MVVLATVRQEWPTGGQSSLTDLLGATEVSIMVAWKEVMIRENSNCVIAKKVNGTSFIILV
jgi:uncharacterized protein YacL (UPF0231 family)